MADKVDETVRLQKFWSDKLLTRISKILLATGQNAGSIIGTLRGSEGGEQPVSHQMQSACSRLGAQAAELPTAARTASLTRHNTCAGSADSY
jgi:hypothetical protein